MATPKPRSSARLYVLMARSAPRAVVFRRGPSSEVALIAWSLKDDSFQVGQWFKGRIYERRCDLSPSGERLIYFAAKYRRPLYTWSAVSRPPFLTALALWPKGDAWGGGGLFDSEDQLSLNHSAHTMKLADGFELPPRVRVRRFREALGRGEDFPLHDVRLRRDGWRSVQVGVERQRGLEDPVWVEYEPPFVYAKSSPRALGKHRAELRMLLRGLRQRNGPWYVLDHEVRSERATVGLPGTDWADWDSNGDLLFAREGKLFRSRVRGRRDLTEEAVAQAEELADFNGLSFEGKAAPEWATRW